MQTHIGKWGASCAIRLPKMAVKTLGLYEGQAVSLHIEDDKLIIKKDTPKYTLETLVAQMNPDSAPEIEMDDAPQGEEWL